MIRPFELHRPTSLPDASALLAELPEAAAYWGGTELLQVMKLGFAEIAHLIDLKRIAALRGIEQLAEGALRIGAGTTHREIERSPLVAAAWPAFVALERQVANPRVRNVGSIGGNLCFAEPHSDPATFLLALEAELEIAGPSGERVLSVDEFVLEPLTTDLARGELLRSIRVPAARPGEVAAYRRTAIVERPAASVACRLTIADGMIAAARITVGSVGPRPALAPGAAAALIGAPIDDIVGATERAGSALRDEIEVDDEPPLSRDYRRHLAGVLLRRAVAEAAERATNPPSGARNA